MKTLLVLALAMFFGDIIIERLIREQLRHSSELSSQQDEPYVALTGLQILHKFVPSGVTIKENTHFHARGATYYPRSHQIIAAPRDFDR